jgi:PhnB protein
MEIKPGDTVERYGNFRSQLLTCFLWLVKMTVMKEKNQKKSVKPIPDGYHTVTPFVIAEGASKLMDFIVRAFGGEITSEMKSDDGKVMHATVKIGDSLVMVSDAMENFPPMPAMLYVYVEDVDSVYRQALNVQGESLREPTDEFYGDRSAGIKDEWGNQWWIATHQEDPTPEEMKKRQEEMMGASSHR